MTITTNDDRDEYTATSGQTVFSYTFKIYASTDLNVYQTPSGSDFNDSTDLITAYTVADVGESAGGTITLDTGATTGDRITIVSGIPSSRTTDYQVSGDFKAPVVNEDIDRIISLQKQAEGIARRALLFPQSQQGTSSLTLPSPVALNYTRWKADLSGLENVDLAATGSPANASVISLEIDGTTTDVSAWANALHVDDYTEARANLASNKYGVDAVVYVRSTGGEEFICETIGSNVDDGGYVLTGGSFALIRKKINSTIVADFFETGLDGALDAVQEGETISLGASDYNIAGKYQLDTIPPGSGGVWLGNTVKNIRIVGAGMPELASDESRFVSGSGTVIQGALINFADGFECYDLAVDVGDYVVDTLASGTYMEGFVPGTHKLDTAWNDAESDYINNVHFNNIRVLLKQAGIPASTQKHGLLVERIDGGSIGYAETIGGEHGFAYKSRNMLGGNIRAWRQTGDAAIFKTDAFTQCSNWQGESLYVGKEGHATRTASVLFQAANSTVLKGVSFNYKARNAKGLERVYDGATARLEDVVIRSADIDDTTVTGITIPSIADRWQICEHTMVNVPFGIISESGCIQCTIGNGSVILATTDGYRLNGEVSHGNLNTKNCGVWGVNNQGIVVEPGRINGSGNTSGNLSGLFNASGLVTYVNSWATIDEGAEIYGGKFHMYGRVGGGSAAHVATIAAGFRPKRDIRIPVVGNNGTIEIPAVITIAAATGFVTLTDYTTFNGGGAANIVFDGAEWEYV